MCCSSPVSNPVARETPPSLKRRDPMSQALSALGPLSVGYLADLNEFFFGDDYRSANSCITLRCIKKSRRSIQLG